MEPRFDDCDLDLHDGHAGVFPGARRNVTESAAATFVLTIFCSCSAFRDANSSRSAACAFRIRDSKANLQLLFSILREVRWKCRVYSPRAIHMDGPLRLRFVKVLQGWRARPLRPADHQAAGGASWMDLSSVRKH